MGAGNGIVLTMRRILTGVAWSFALLWMANFVNLVLGSSATLLTIVALAVGILIALDPMHRIWEAPDNRRPAATPDPYPTTEAIAQS